MCKIFAITNRKLFPDEAAFLAQVERIAAAGIDGVILREKDLSPEDYLALAKKVRGLCALHKVDFIPHSFAEAARRMGCRKLHLPWDVFLREGIPGGFRAGVSVHSLEDARRAAGEGAAALIAGNVFETACKAGLPGRGLAFLSRVCGAIKIPVYAVGGISPENIALVVETGAAGACLMSSLMESPDPGALIRGIKKPPSKRR